VYSESAGISLFHDSDNEALIFSSRVYVTNALLRDGFIMPTY
jgi:hypothetical protein